MNVTASKLLRGKTLDVDEPRGAMYKYARLAAAGTGEHQRRLRRRTDGLTLRVIQVIEDWCDIHWRPAADGPL